MDKYLVLYLDSPMQSWGYMSKFDNRRSYNFPTKSGIIGMICAAMGIDRADNTLLPEFNKLKITVYDLSSKLFREIDFHTVGGGYDSKTQKSYIVKTANGDVGNTVVTRREYLMDAKFGVILSGEEALLKEISVALLNPVWGIWLGRKSCVPAAQICHGIVDSIDLAEEKLKEVWKKLYPDKTFNLCKSFNDSVIFENGTESLMDNPENFFDRKFNVRRVAVE